MFTSKIVQGVHFLYTLYSILPYKLISSICNAFSHWKTPKAIVHGKNQVHMGNMSKYIFWVQNIGNESKNILSPKNVGNLIFTMVK